MANATTPALTDEQLDEIAALDAVIDRLDEIRSGASKTAKYGAGQPWPVFIRRMRLLTPQSYGTRIQHRLTEHHGWTTVPATLDRGDVVDHNGNYWEIKVTMITASNPGVNFVQIRPHQDISGYHCFVIQPDYTVVHLHLTKKQMAEEIKALGSSAHGTAAAVKRNTNKEYAIRFPWTPDEGTAKEWIAKYAVHGPQPD